MSISDTLISFETAKLAREKGFILGIGWHGMDDKFYYNGQLTDNHRGDNPCAPTQALLQKWLREVHKCIVLVDFYNNGDTWEDTEYNVTISEFKHFKTHDSFVKDRFKTWEEALEVGLQESLKLI